MMDSLATLFQQLPGAAARIVHLETLPPQAAQFAKDDPALPPALQAALLKLGISRLYAHQAAAVETARAGAHLGVVTSTASGKTLCYQLPVLECMLRRPASRALFLFPTKALAHDQLRSLEGLLTALESEKISAATLDGDTPSARRATIRGNTQIILSNPDMLHRSILPDHRRWARWLANLRFVVIDEAHTYRGVFGTHVALILRRLQRLCAYYGGAPQFICCSATSANPQEHLSALIGEAVTVLSEDGAPRGLRTFAFWNPPEHAPGAGGKTAGRRSTNVEAAQLFAALLRLDIKTLTFAKSRRAAELMLRYAREALTDEAPELAERIRAYRSGYHAEERRALEQAFQQGDVRGLISTNALELGVDIGGVDAVVLSGFPGTIASTWQQAGRAGRSQGSSLAVLVAQDDPLDQFYMRHPAQFFSRSHEQARIALQNPYILSDQLCCAAGEIPLVDADEHWFGPTMAALRDYLLRHERLLPLDDGTAIAAGKPWAHVNIRSADGLPVVLRDAESGRTIEQIPSTRAAFEVFEGAVYLHQGDTYLVQRRTPGEAFAKRSQLNYYTHALDETDIQIERTDQQRECGGAQLCFGVVSVTRQVTGYRRKAHYSEEVISEHELSSEPNTFRTQAVWWILPEGMSAKLERASGDLPGALHAMEHTAIGLLPLFAQCDRADIGGLSTALHPGTNRATIFVYDGVPGGVGIAQVGYEQAEVWWQATRDLLRDCPCSDGCPACIQSPKCGNGNQYLSKRAARMLAETLCGAPLPEPGQVTGRPVPQVRTADQRSVVLADLRERVERAKREHGPRRLALIAALLYRLANERKGPFREDVEALAILDEIEQSARQLASEP